MAEKMNTYWNENGKHQEGLNRLNGLLPNWGMTDNKFMNLFIVASNVYYDVYNNGGCNLKDNYPEKVQEYLVPFASDLKSLRLNVLMSTLVRNFKNKAKLEAFLDEIVLYLQDKDLNYDKYTLFFDNEKEILSKTKVEGFSVITFGNEKDYSDWMNFRMNQWNFKLVDNTSKGRMTKMAEHNQVNRCCNRCNSKVTKSELKEYSYQCMECDEDLYEFETHTS